MLISLRSPLGGRPVRQWTLWPEKGQENVKVLDTPESAVITPESYYCIKIGYLKDGEPALIKDTEAFNLYKLLKKHYRQ